MRPLPNRNSCWLQAAITINKPHAMFRRAEYGALRSLVNDECYCEAKCRRAIAAVRLDQDFAFFLDTTM